MKSNSTLLIETLRDKLGYSPKHMEYWIKEYGDDSVWSLYIKVGKYNEKTGRIADWFVAPNIYHNGRLKIRDANSLKQAIQQLKDDLKAVEMYSKVK